MNLYWKKRIKQLEGWRDSRLKNPINKEDYEKVKKAGLNIFLMTSKSPILWDTSIPIKLKDAETISRYIYTIECLCRKGFNFYERPNALTIVVHCKIKEDKVHKFITIFPAQAIWILRNGPYGIMNKDIERFIEDNLHP